MKRPVLTFGSALSALAALAASPRFEQLTVTADSLSADRTTGALVATGHVYATCLPARFYSNHCTRDARGCAHFDYPTMVTTCTNDVDCLHWSLTSETEYLPEKYIWMRNAWVRFFGVPILWMPYWKYPLDEQNALRIMPGWSSRWGAYLLSKVVYPLAGDPTHGEGTWWLHGNTRLDLREKQGVAVGETLYWQLGDAGRGKFKVYYAWDADHDRYDSSGWYVGSTDRNYRNWGSSVPSNRYGVELRHRWEVTERDVLRVDGQLFSDSYFQSDFLRNESIFTIRNDFESYLGNELAWEHTENPWALGISVLGPLNEFFPGTGRLPEAYVDVAPQPVLSLPVNYESQTRAGYMYRQAGRYGSGDWVTAYNRNPGAWAFANTFRLDTYHRFSVPLRLFDVVSAVPRLGLRGTYWNDSGRTVLDGWSGAGKTGEAAWRGILEAGVTFAARGTAWVDDAWQHVLEPYADVLAQECQYTGLSDGSRPYVFDNLDASLDWSDQFAGRSRNLPYSYYGVTPGVRNAMRRLEANGELRRVLDVDVYAALQFNSADWVGADEWHRLAEPGSPNYGKGRCLVVPGVRTRWFPTKETALSAAVEYDGDNNRLSLANVRWEQRLTPGLRYYAGLVGRDHRLWDYSSVPYDPELMTGDDFNHLRFWFAEAGYEREVCDAFAYSPFVRWDCREGELDSAGIRFDLRTDCLGFRFLVEYDNAYTRIDGSVREEDWNFGFYVYLRAFGPGTGLGAE